MHFLHYRRETYPLAGTCGHINMSVSAVSIHTNDMSVLLTTSSSLSLRYAVKNADSLLGLQAPEPLAKLYSRDFYRATWLGA